MTVMAMCILKPARKHSLADIYNDALTRRVFVLVYGLLPQAALVSKNATSQQQMFQIGVAVL